MACKSVLVVEDDLDIRESLEQILEIEGYQPLLAENGQAAVEILEHGARPCLILLDLMMPVMNGWEFLEQSRKDSHINEIPIVLISGQVVARETAALWGLAGYVEKPIKIDSLIQTVKKNLLVE